MLHDCPLFLLLEACGRRSQLQAASTSEALQYTGKMTVYGKAKGGPTDRLTLQHMRVSF